MRLASHGIRLGDGIKYHEFFFFRDGRYHTYGWGGWGGWGGWTGVGVRCGQGKDGVERGWVGMRWGRVGRCGGTGEVG